MANQPNDEFEAAKVLHKLIQESKDEPMKLATKLYVILQHMRASGKENSMPFQVISRAMKTVIEQHNIDIDALMTSRAPAALGTQVGDSASSQLAVDPNAGSSQRPGAVINTQISLPLNDAVRPDTSSRAQAAPSSDGQDIYRGGPSKVQGSAPSAPGSYPVVESGFPNPMAFGGSSYDNHDFAPNMDNDIKMNQFSAASSAGKAVEDGGNHTVANRVIHGVISNNAPDNSIHKREISRDTGKFPVSGMPFKEQQLKQLRAQCLVFLSFRNGLMPKQLHLDIALGISIPKDDGQRRELADHKGKEQPSLEPNNAHDLMRSRVDTVGDAVRFTSGSSLGMVVDANSSKEAENSNTTDVRSGAPSFQYENVEDGKTPLSSKMPDSSELTISQASALGGLQPDLSSRGLPDSNDVNNLKNTAQQIGLTIQAPFIMGTGQVLKESVPSQSQTEGDTHVTQLANNILPSLHQKEQVTPISGDGRNYSAMMTRNVPNESEPEDENDSVSADWPSSAKYTIVGKWILDRQKRKATFEQKLLRKQQKTEHRIAASSEKLKESVSSSEDIFAKTKSMIELKKLQLLELQRRLRSDILSDFFKPVGPEMDNLKSIKKHRIGRKSKQLERYEQRMKEERQKRIRERQKEFFAEVDVHRERLEDIFKMRRERWKGFNKSAREFHKKKERIHREKIDRIQREKINLLKINDVEGYLRMVQDTKSDRVKQLLKETEKYLQALGAKLQDAKAMARRFESEVDESITTGSVEKTEFVAEDEDDSDQAKHYLESNEKYYMMAHSVKENIVVQPSSLVGGKLREYQMNGLRWLVSLYNNTLNGILADEMGLGKTVQVISLICYLMETKNDRGPFLVVVPSSVLPGWETEINFWAPSILRIVYSGSPEERRKLFKERIVHQKFNVLLTTYEYLMNKHDRPKLSKIHWHYIIIDEGHRIKNASCKLNADLKQYKSNHRLLLTGTPLQNNLEELWALLNFLLPDIFNSSDDFSQWFNKPFEGNGDNSPDEALLSEEENLLIINRLHQVLRPFVLRRLKHKVEHELPEKIERLIRCEASAYQKLLMKRVEDNLGAIGASKARTVHNSVMELRNICNHPYLSQLHVEEVHDFVPKHYLPNIIRFCGKLEMLDRLLPKLKATDHRVLLFSTMTRLLDVMEDYLCWKQYKYLRLDGHTSGGDRGALIDNFNKPGSPYFIFLLSIRAGGVGVNLQAADTVIIFDTDWNPQVDLQAQARAHRIGQKKDVLVLRLETVQTVEEQVRAAAEHKLGVANQSITAGFFDNNTSAEDRREYLESLLRESKKEEDAPVLDDDALNDRIARSISEIDIFESVDKLRLEEESATWKQLNPGTGSEISETTALLPPRLLPEEDLKSFYEAMKVFEAAHPGVQSTGGGKRKGEHLGSLDIQHYGRGKRAREVRSYEERWTEDDFEKLCQVELPGSPNIEEETTDKKLSSFAIGPVVVTGEVDHLPVPMQSLPQPSVDPTLPENKEVTPPPKRGRGRPRRTVAVPVTPVLSALTTPGIGITGNSQQVACTVTNTQTTFSLASSYQSTPYSTPVQGGEHGGKSLEASKRKGKKQNLLIQDVTGVRAPSKDEKLETEKQSVPTSCFPIASEACSARPALVVDGQNAIPSVPVKQPVIGKVEVLSHHLPDISSLVAPTPESPCVDPIMNSASKSVPVARVSTGSGKPETEKGSLIISGSSVAPGACSTSSVGAEKGQIVMSPVLGSQPSPVIARVDVMGSQHRPDASPLVASGPGSHPVGPANTEYPVKNILAPEMALSTPPVLPDLLPSESTRGRGRGGGGGRVRGRGRGRGRGRKGQVGSEGSVAIETRSTSSSGANMTQNATPLNSVIQPSPIIGKVNVGSQNQSNACVIVAPEPESQTTVPVMTSASTKSPAVISIPPATELPSSAPTVSPDFHLIPLQSEPKRGRGRGRKTQGRGDGSITSASSYFTGGAKKIGVVPPIPVQASVAIGKIDVDSKQTSGVSAFVVSAAESLPAGPVLISASKEYPVIKSISASELASSIPSVIPDVPVIPSQPEPKRGRGRGRKTQVGGEGSNASTSSSSQGRADKEHNIIPSVPAIQSSYVRGEGSNVSTCSASQGGADKEHKFISSGPVIQSSYVRGEGSNVSTCSDSQGGTYKEHNAILSAPVIQSSSVIQNVVVGSQHRSDVSALMTPGPESLHDVPIVTRASNEYPVLKSIPAHELASSTPVPDSQLIPPQSEPKRGRGRGRKGKRQDPLELVGVPKSSEDPKSVGHPQKRTRLSAVMKSSARLNLVNEPLNVTPGLELGVPQTKSDQASGEHVGESHLETHDGQPDISPCNATLAVAHGSIVVGNATKFRNAPSGFPVVDVRNDASPRNDRTDSPTVPVLSANELLRNPNSCRESSPAVSVEIADNSSAVETGNILNKPRSRNREDSSQAGNSLQAGTAVISADLSTNRVCQVDVKGSTSEMEEQKSILVSEAMLKESFNGNNLGTQGLPSSSKACILDSEDQSLDFCVPLSCDKSEVGKDGEHEVPHDEVKIEASESQAGNSDMEEAVQVGMALSDTSETQASKEDGQDAGIMGNLLMTEFCSKKANDQRLDDSCTPEPDFVATVPLDRVTDQMNDSESGIQSETISLFLDKVNDVTLESQDAGDVEKYASQITDVAIDQRSSSMVPSAVASVPSLRSGSAIDDDLGNSMNLSVEEEKGVDDTTTENICERQPSDEKMRMDVEISVLAPVAPVSHLSPTNAETHQGLTEVEETGNLDIADTKCDGQVSNENGEIACPVPHNLADDTSALTPGADISSANNGDLFGEAGNRRRASEEDRKSEEKSSVSVPAAQISILSLTDAETLQRLPEDVETSNLDKADGRFDGHVSNESGEIEAEVPNTLVNDGTSSALTLVTAPSGSGTTSINSGEAGNIGRASEEKKSSVCSPVAPISDLSLTNAETNPGLQESEETGDIDKTVCICDDQVTNESRQMEGSPAPNILEVNDTSTLLRETAPASSTIAFINSEDLSSEGGCVGQEKEFVPCDPVLRLHVPETTETRTEDINEKNRDASDASAGAGIASINSWDLCGEEGNDGQDKGSVPCASLLRSDVPETMDAAAEDVKDHNSGEIGASAGASIASINSGCPSGEIGNDGQEEPFPRDALELDVPEIIDTCTEYVKDKIKNVVDASAGAATASMNSGCPSGEVGNDGPEESFPRDALELDVPERIDACTEDVKDGNEDTVAASAGANVASIFGCRSSEAAYELQDQAVPSDVLELDVPKIIDACTEDVEDENNNVDALAGAATASINSGFPSGVVGNDGQMESIPRNALELDVPKTVGAYTEDVEDGNKDTVTASAGANVASIFWCQSSEAGNDGQEEAVPPDVLEFDFPEIIDACTEDVKDENKNVVDASAGVASASINSGFPSGEAGNDGQMESVPCNALELDVPERIDACTEDVKDENKGTVAASAGANVASINSGCRSSEAGNDGQDESVPPNVPELDVPEIIDACTEDVEDENKNFVDASAGAATASISTEFPSGEASNDGQMESVPRNSLELDVPETVGAYTEDVKDGNRDVSESSAGGTTCKEGSGALEKELVPCNVPGLNVPETVDPCTEDIKGQNRDLSGKTGDCGEEKESVPCHALESDVLETIDACTEYVEDRNWDISDASNLSSAGHVDTAILTGECQVVNEDQGMKSVSNIEASGVEDHLVSASDCNLEKTEEKTYDTE